MAKKSIDPIIAEINKNFLIRVKKANEKHTFLLGAGQYKDLVGEKLKNKHFKEVLGKGLQVFTFKIRNRLTIKFISK